MSWCPKQRRRFLTASWFALADALLAIAGASHAAPPASEPEGTETLLAVSVNGQVMPETLLLTRPDGQVFARMSDLLRWRFAVSKFRGITHEGVSYVALDTIPGVRWHIQPSTQTLVIHTAIGSFETSVLGRGWRPSAQPPAPPVGGFFNYDLAAQRADHRSSAGGLFEAVAFGPWGSLSNSAVARSGAVDGASGRFVRLNSAWTLDRPGDVATWRIGDTISQAGSWSRPVRLGGLQYATNFSTQPGFITFPVPRLAGAAALPSTVDIYVNDALRARQDVLAGPFSIPELPVLSGMGEARVVVRDLLGREQTILAPFYATAQLLRPGLRDFSYEIGALRSGYGMASADYGQWVAVGTERRGISETMTGEVHGEVSKDRQAAGIGGAWLWPSAGVFSASLGGSRSGHGRGAISSLGFQRQTNRLSFGGNVLATTRRFVPLGLRRDPSAARQQAQAHVVLGTSAYGAFGLNYVRQAFRDRRGAELVSANWGFGLGRHGYLRLTLLRDLNGREVRASAQFSRSLGPDMSMSASATSGSDSRSAEVQLQRNLPVGTGVGYRVAAAGGDISRADGTLLMQNDVGTYGMDVSAVEGRTNYRASVAGGVAAIGNHVFASRTINESFSVVDVPGFADVRVYAANQLVGRTRADGTALIPRLLPYQSNAIRIEQADLPIDATVDALAADAVPYFRSGVLLQFPVRRSRGALVTVLLDDGVVIPSGATARLGHGGERFPAGERGEIYLTGLSKENDVRLSWAGQECTLRIPFPDSTDPLPHLGTYVCHGVKR